MSNWRSSEDRRAAATPLTKVLINGVERSTLAQRISYEDVVAGAGFLKRMREGERFFVTVTEPSDGAGGTRVRKLAPGESVEVPCPFGLVSFDVQEDSGERVQSNGASGR